MARTVDLTTSFTYDEVLSEIDFEDALKWYKKDLNRESYIELLEEALKEVK